MHLSAGCGLGRTDGRQPKKRNDRGSAVRQAARASSTVLRNELLAEAPSAAAQTRRKGRYSERMRRKTENRDAEPGARPAPKRGERRAQNLLEIGGRRLGLSASHPYLDGLRGIRKQLSDCSVLIQKSVLLPSFVDRRGPLGYDQLLTTESEKPVASYLDARLALHELAKPLQS